MSTDRELLEKAAKAAGYQVDQRSSFMTWREYRKLALLNPAGGHTLWNAEDDDGDALRLAVKLGVRFCAAGNFNDCSIAGLSFGPGGVFVEKTGTDPYAATRRAIVRAAAAMAGADTKGEP